MDVSKLSTDELKKLSEQVKREINDRRVQQVSAARADILKIAKEAGISVDELAGIGQSRKSPEKSKSQKKSGSNGPGPKASKEGAAVGQTRH